MDRVADITTRINKVHAEVERKRERRLFGYALPAAIVIGAVAGILILGWLARDVVWVLY